MDIEIIKQVNSYIRVGDVLSFPEAIAEKLIEKGIGKRPDTAPKQIDSAPKKTVRTVKK